ncbi:hypothetical protein CVT25_010666 [Psilocybe cyanescens]|uniref:Uncharacterized protein n=1 Tax=Psilocybe cyanescens TaxID=93625 RepID=A0A409XSZ0_PSICY|nr:hypothetical protein CVT25_010666 [Psilocybe cyanescens]
MCTLSSLTSSAVSSRVPTPRHSSLLLSSPSSLLLSMNVNMNNSYPLDKYDTLHMQQQQSTICNLPLKYFSDALPARFHPALAPLLPASAILLNEILKGSISIIITKILTTAAFSVALFRKKLIDPKWLSLFFMAIGVGIVQIQNAAMAIKPPAVGSAQEFHHAMNPLKGFTAVTASCFTLGLAGVYFEMVLKGSKADLWVRNV